jgi:hypothetical protein
MDVTFISILKMYYSQGAVYLGKMEDPISNEKIINLPQAKLLIDILTILKDKTRGNLNDNEERLLIEILDFLQVNYNKEIDNNISSQ